MWLRAARQQRNLLTLWAGGERTADLWRRVRLYVYRDRFAARLSQE